jgi:hypothetical protein
MTMTTTTAHAPVRVLDATAYRDGRWWTIAIPELTSTMSGGGRFIAMGQSRLKRNIAANARDLAAVWLDVDESEVDVRVTILDQDPYAD